MKTWIIAADPNMGRVIEIDEDRPAEVRSFARDTTIATPPKVPEPSKSLETVDGERQALKIERQPDETQRIALTREIGDYVEQARRLRRFEKLVLVADPNMLVNLRRELSKESMKLVASEVSRDVTHRNINEIRDYLAPYI